MPQLSEKISMNPNSIYGYNLEKEPRYSTLEKISKVLDVSISLLSDKYRDKNKNNKTIDLDDESTVMTFEGKSIPKKYKETFKNILMIMENE